MTHWAWFIDIQNDEAILFHWWTIGFNILASVFQAFWFTVFTTNCLPEVPHTWLKCCRFFILFISRIVLPLPIWLYTFMHFCPCLLEIRFITCLFNHDQFVLFDLITNFKCRVLVSVRPATKDSHLMTFSLTVMFLLILKMWYMLTLSLAEVAYWVTASCMIFKVLNLLLFLRIQKIIQAHPLKFILTLIAARSELLDNHRKVSKFSLFSFFQALLLLCVLFEVLDELFIFFWDIVISDLLEVSKNHCDWFFI